MRPFQPNTCARCSPHLRAAQLQRSRRSITTQTFQPYSANPSASAAKPSPTTTPQPPISSSQTLLTLQTQTLHQYKVSQPPTPPQLKHSNSFFHSPPRLLWTTATFRQFPASSHPEVAFLGRSNVGKSSLLNALFNRTSAQVARTSKKPGRTRTMNAFGLGGGVVPIAEGTAPWKAMGPGGVVVVDMPGYGQGSRGEWGTEILKYIEGRKQLRRTFLLVDAEHGLKTTDVTLLRHLAERGISHQIILSKVDKLLFPNSKPPSPQKLSKNLYHLQSVYEDIRQRLQDEDGRVSRSLGDILCCSSEKELQSFGLGRGRLGIDAVRWAVLSAAGLECDQNGQKRKYDSVTIEQDET